LGGACRVPSPWKGWVWVRGELREVRGGTVGQTPTDSMQLYITYLIGRYRGVVMGFLPGRRVSGWVERCVGGGRLRGLGGGLGAGGTVVRRMGRWGARWGMKRLGFERWGWARRARRVRDLRRSVVLHGDGRVSGVRRVGGAMRWACAWGGCRGNGGLRGNERSGGWTLQPPYRRRRY
jgi:hypothetical protein